MYRKERFDAYMGFGLPSAMKAEIELEARRAVRTPSEFGRIIINLGLKCWRQMHQLREEER
jgi:hypothetical protein